MIKLLLASTGLTSPVDVVDKVDDLAEVVKTDGASNVMTAVFVLLILVSFILYINDNRKDRDYRRKIDEMKLKKEEEDEDYLRKILVSNSLISERALDLIEGNRDMHVEMDKKLTRSTELSEDIYDMVKDNSKSQDESNKKIEGVIEEIRDIKSRQEDYSATKSILTNIETTLEDLKDRLL